MCRKLNVLLGEPNTYSSPSCPKGPPLQEWQGFTGSWLNLLWYVHMAPICFSCSVCGQRDNSLNSPYFPTASGPGLASEFCTTLSLSLCLPAHPASSFSWKIPFCLLPQVFAQDVSSAQIILPLLFPGWLISGPIRVWSSYLRRSLLWPCVLRACDFHL